MSVVETIRVRAEGNNIRRGIYRDFPTTYRDRLRNFVKVDFRPTSVLRNGESEAWHIEQKSNGTRVYMGSANRTLKPGIHEYRLAFTTNRQLGFFDDFDELYFNVIGNGWMFPIDRAVATVTLPFPVAANQPAASAVAPVHPRPRSLRQGGQAVTRDVVGDLESFPGDTLDIGSRQLVARRETDRMHQNVQPVPVP